MEYLLIPDEGHGFARPVNNMAAVMATEKFLAQYLGGRYQEGGTPEVVARLKEITVDPKTVVLAKKVEAGSVGVPKLAMDLQPGTYKYQARIEMGAQKISLTISTTIAEDSGAWSATDVMETCLLYTSDWRSGETQAGNGVRRCSRRSDGRAKIMPRFALKYPFFEMCIRDRFPDARS